MDLRRRTVRHRLYRRHVTMPPIRECVPVLSPYMDRLREAAFGGETCRIVYVTFPN